LFVFYFYSEGGRSIFLQSVGNHLQGCTVSSPEDVNLRFKKNILFVWRTKDTETSEYDDVAVL
jgi:hypothetical protein